MIVFIVSIFLIYSVKESSRYISVVSTLKFDKCDNYFYTTEKLNKKS